MLGSVADTSKQFNKLKKLIDWNFFKREELNSKKHRVHTQFEGQEAQTENRLSIGTFQLCLHSGKDFDFAPVTPQKRELEPQTPAKVRKTAGESLMSLMDSDYLLASST